MAEVMDTENYSDNGVERNFDPHSRKRKSSTVSSSSDNSSKKSYSVETDPAVLARKQKDIDYGKNTIGYDNYIKAIPKHERADHHPRTPLMYKKLSRRNWDATVRKWRRALHEWDPTDKKEEPNKSPNENDSKESNMQEQKGNNNKSNNETDSEEINLKDEGEKPINEKDDSVETEKNQKVDSVSENEKFIEEDID